MADYLDDIKKEYKGEIHPSLRPFIKQRDLIRQELLDGYVAIYEAAKAGHPIAAVDFSQIQERYNQKLSALWKAAQRAMPAIAKEDGDMAIIGHLDIPDDPFAPPPKNPKWVVSQKEINAHAEELLHRFKMSTLLEAGEHEILTERQKEAMQNHEVYDRAVRHRFGPFPAKNLSLDAATDTREELLPDLLSKNPGVAVTDIHIYGESKSLLAQQMATLKKSGVDTIYIEENSNKFKEYQDLSLAELKQLKADRRYKEVFLFTPPDREPDNPERSRMDVDGANLDFLIALRENNIRLVNIDHPEPARGFADMAHRLGDTNMSWAEAIRRDREMLAAQGKGGGKYIVWGGIDHFVDRVDGKGLVDDVLGIPTIGFDRLRKDAPVAIRRGEHNEADFYLPGGMQMLDAAKNKQLADISELLDVARAHNASAIPGVDTAIAMAVSALGAYKGQLVKSLDDDGYKAYEDRDQFNAPPTPPGKQGEPSPKR